MPRNGGIYDKKNSHDRLVTASDKSLSKGDRPYGVTQSGLTGD